MNRPSIVFLDRDGTIVVDEHYPSDPDRLRLIDGAAAAMARLNGEGIPVVVVTNQSGIGRGYYDVETYDRVNERFLALLEDRGAHVDAIFYCPHAPDADPPCACRKPGTALFEEGLRRFGVSADDAVYVGDRARDVSPSLALGGTGILIVGPDGRPEDAEWAEREGRTAGSLSDAVEQILGSY